MGSRPLHLQGDGYYAQVARYYDEEAASFEKHYDNNPILQRLRSDFRAVTEEYSATAGLEIGCGPGIDLHYFAGKYPHALWRGIDVSSGMVEQARAKLAACDASDVRAEVGTPETIEALFPGRKFDLIYCYFGALNTVSDLEMAARALAKALAPNGAMVLTFVNRWYLADMIWNLLRGRPRRALARVTQKWAGYAPERPLDSMCRSATAIKKIFSPLFTCTKRRGYSIFYPAWYRHRFIPVNGFLGKALWRLDCALNHTPFWNLGEYSLYVFTPRQPKGDQSCRASRHE